MGEKLYIVLPQTKTKLKSQRNSDSNHVRFFQAVSGAHSYVELFEVIPKLLTVIGSFHSPINLSRSL